MKRSHSGSSTEEEKRYSVSSSYVLHNVSLSLRHQKVQTGIRDLNESESQRIIVELEKEVEVLQKQDKSRNDLMKLSELNLARKQQELDQSIEEIMVHRFL